MFSLAAQHIIYKFCISTINVEQLAEDLQETTESINGNILFLFFGL